jgi:hypothetical protein
MKRLVIMGKGASMGSVASFHLGHIWSMISLCDDSGRGQGGETMVSFKGAHFPQGIIKVKGQWYDLYRAVDKTG